MSPDLVGDGWRVCECEECRSFPPPDRKPKLGKYGMSIIWRGRLWSKRKDGYYDGMGGLLHRCIYEAHFGPIPRGVEIHHRDKDKSNNTLENFEALLRADHRKQHARREHELVCIICGTDFQAAIPRALYCSTACKSYANKLDRGWIPYRKYQKCCEFCGNEFLCQRENRARFCCKSCARRSRYAYLRDQRATAAGLQPRS